MPNPERLLATLNRATDFFRRTPGRRGRVVRLSAGAEVLIAGDMHGNLENLRLLLQRAGLSEHPARHLVLQELIHGPFRYPKGGDKSHQMLDVLAALKCQFPERVHFLLGNHELSQWRGHRIGKGDVDQNDVFIAGVQEAYGEWADEIVAAYNRLFEASDLVILTANRIVLCHSFPGAKYLESFNLPVLEEEELPPDAYLLGGPVHSLVWGRNVSAEHARACLQKFDADLAITGHIPCDQGYMVPNDRQIILDALGTPACYCLFPTDRVLNQHDLLQAIETL